MQFPCKNVQHFTWRMRISQFFFLLNCSDFFPCSFPFRFSLLSYCLYLLLCAPLLQACKVLILINGKPWKGDHDQVRVYWPACFSSNFTPKTDRVFYD